MTLSQLTATLDRFTDGWTKLYVGVRRFATFKKSSCMSRKAGRKATYLLGAVISLAAAVWVYYGAGDGVRGEINNDLKKTITA